MRPRMLSKHEGRCTLVISPDLHPEHPDEACFPPAERFAPGCEVIVTHCGSVGRSCDRIKSICRCGCCSGGERIVIEKIIIGA